MCPRVCITGRKKCVIDLSEFKNKSMSLILCLSFPLLSKHHLYYFLTLQSRSLCFTICSHCGWKMATLQLWGVYFSLMGCFSIPVPKSDGKVLIGQPGSDVSHCGCLSNTRDAGLRTSLSHLGLTSKGKQIFSRQVLQTKYNRFFTLVIHIYLKRRKDSVRSAINIWDSNILELNKPILSLFCHMPSRRIFYRVINIIITEM